MKRACGMLIGAVAAAVVGLSGAAQAAPLTISGYPDLASNELNVSYTYNSTTQIGTFVITGTVDPGNPWELWNSAGSRMASPIVGDHEYTSGTFSLTANIQVTGATTFSNLSGSLTVNAPGSTPLFTSSTLSAFGFSTGSTGNGVDQWQFEFTNGGGTYGALGQIGVDVTGDMTKYAVSGGANSGQAYDTVSVDLTESFSSVPLGGEADTFVVVPLPRAAMMGLAVPLLLVLRRRSQVFQAV
ncbi:MAG TPA: hypothetical protein VH253_20965 [Phycisphaerae bacterium]|nr:hypothetical protein [Phycisphaerae bacterium]